MKVTRLLKILLLSNSLDGGGAERFAARLVAGLDESRIQPHVALLRGPGDWPLPRDVAVHVLDYHGPKDLPRTVWRLRRILRTLRPHVVLGVGTSVNVVAGCAFRVPGGRPAWIARVDTHRRDLRFRRWLLKSMYPMADAIVANSRGMQQALIDDYPGLKGKISSIFNPVDFERIEELAGEAACWKMAGNAPLLVTVGHATPAKRWDILIGAFSRLVRTIPAQLVICGDGPLLSRHKQQVRQLNVQSCVHFLGHCPNPFPILAQADLFVFSSESEGSPNALIEAQGMGLCAVATRCRFGPEEIVRDGHTGLLVPVNDAPALARAIGTLLKNPSLKAEMGRSAALQARRRYDYARQCRQWQALILKHAAG